MELLRDDVVVQPISTLRTREGPLRATDRDAYYGTTKYPPEAFRPGVEVVLRVWLEDNEEPTTITLREELLNNISRNFELYSEAMPS